MYRKIDRSIGRALQDIVGSGNLLVASEELEPYSHDENPTLRYPPEAVVKPADQKEIAAIVKLAARMRFPVIPRGGGTGLTGGALAVYGGVVVSLERMQRLREIDEKNLMAVVEPGMITGEFHRTVEKRGLFYPPDPASLEDCSIGGNLAEDSGGPRAVKYGVTRDYTTGIAAVLPNGEMIDYGGKLVKNVTGYSLLDLLIGSEGTLGIITAATVRLLPRPACRAALLAAFPSSESAVTWVSRVLRSRARPSAIEFMDGNCLSIAQEVLGAAAVTSGAEAQVLIEIDGNRESEVRRQLSNLGGDAARSHARSVREAGSPRQQEQLWAARRKLREALRTVSPVLVGQDVVVPRAEIAALIRGIGVISRESGLEIACFGHAGDGNIHVNFLKRDLDARTWRGRLARATRKVFALAVRLGGTISGEHGIGLAKKRYLPLALKPPAIRAMRSLKTALDPKNIMNPGKIF